MFYKFIIFLLYLLTTITFKYPLYASDYCIFLKNGKTILAEDHWYENENLHAVIRGATIVIEKYKIDRIIDTEQFNNRSDLKEKELINNFSKFVTNGAIFILTDGKMISVRKSWIENSKVFCLNNNNLITFKFNDINDVLPTNRNDELNIPIIDNKKNITFEKDPITKSIVKKIEETQKICNDLHTKLQKMDERYKDITLKNKKESYEQFKNFQATNDSLKDEHMSYLFKLRGCKKELERLDGDLNNWKTRYFDEVDRQKKETKWKNKFSEKFK